MTERPPKTPGTMRTQEIFEGIKKLFVEAEMAFELGGREAAKPYLHSIYHSIENYNWSDTSGDGGWKRQFEWNPEGVFTKEEFEELNLRRKKLSNAIGILRADGTVRHDLNKI